MAQPEQEGATAFLALYERALPIVYGYLVSRCGDRVIAEDLTSETFLACARALEDRSPADLSVPWIVGVARHKLVDHWRKQARDARALAVIEGDADDAVDPEEPFDLSRTGAVLRMLQPDQRAALTLRYVDGLSVPTVADHLGRTIHATEALLMRAKRAFRRAYLDGDEDA